MTTLIQGPGWWEVDWQANSSTYCPVDFYGPEGGRGAS